MAAWAGDRAAEAVVGDEGGEPLGDDPLRVTSTLGPAGRSGLASPALIGAVLEACEEWRGGVVDVLAGIDVGTTSTKAALFDLDGRPLAAGRATMPWTTTVHGAEADPEAPVTAALTALRAVLTQAPGLRVAALGVTGMAESGVLLGPGDAPLAPIIAWHDTRDQAERDRLEADLGRQPFSAATGLPSGTQWTITKHGWLQTHQPETRRARRWLNVPEWVVHRLGGDQGCEPSLASRTGWFNLSHRDWWRPGLAWSGIDTNLFPPLAPAGTALGRAAGPHLPAAIAGAVLTVAGHDHQVAAVGLGAAGAGDAVDSCGTANALLRTVPPTLPEGTIVSLTDNGITVGWHVLAHRWCLLGDTRSGLMLGRVLGRLRSGNHDLPELDAAANSVAADRYEPLLGADLLAAEADPAVLWRAALETAAVGTAEVREVMARHVGREAKLVATGGWARDHMLLAIKRRALGPIEHLEIGESGCRGAALFAGIAAGLYGSIDECPPPTIVKGAV